ncbi:hypothetical protein DPV79_21340 [Burkholderia reimsis]|uniref:Uncharacterized protein n=1 Tax=Burkholderia reimsis TaxID=2234132 RepID=A0A365QSA6_9BURK|nr:hypothetical protein [Burkholderia reimsis]RBB37543.1 hypothetical protein DPV79_21340 [Burkholderia reimsis]
MINALPLALALYWLLEYVVRRASYCAEMEPATFQPPWQTGCEWAIVISPGFWLSHYFKSRIQHFAGANAVSARRTLITRSNWLNVLVSMIFLILGLLTTLAARGTFGWSLVADLVVVRYISRTTEIGYAFGRDVMTPPDNRSGLDKHARLTLALRSYVELFLLAMPVYLLCVPHYGTVLRALTLSLSVGTLTNVGYGLPLDQHGYRALLVFPQVIATLSLVLLSLASYISRPEPKSTPEADAEPK